MPATGQKRSLNVEHFHKMTIKELTYLLALASFAGVAICYVIGDLSKHWPKTSIRSLYSLQQPEFTRLGWQLRNTAFGLSCLGVAFGIVSYLS